MDVDGAACEIAVVVAVAARGSCSRSEALVAILPFLVVSVSVMVRVRVSNRGKAILDCGLRCILIHDRLMSCGCRYPGVPSQSPRPGQAQGNPPLVSRLQ